MLSYQNSQPGQYSLRERPVQPGHTRQEDTDSVPGMNCCCCNMSSNFKRLEDDTDSVRSEDSTGCCLKFCLRMCCSLDEYTKEKRALRTCQCRNEELEAKSKRDENTIRDQREDLAQKEGEIHDLTLRVSKLASEKMREGNACVEDLSDTRRPSAITDKWSGLFRSGEYWTTFENISQTGKSEADTAELLYQVCKVIFETCVEIVDTLVPNVVTSQPRAGQGPAGPTPSQWQAKDRPELRRNLVALLPENESDVEDFLQRLSDDVATVQRKLRRSVVEFLRVWKQPLLVQERVMQAIQSRVTEVGDVALVCNFATELTPLCFAMRLHDIPVTVSFDFDPGSSVNTSLFEVEGGQESGLEPRVVRPPLLRETGGAVLLKGELQYMKAASPQEDVAQSDVPRTTRAEWEQFGDTENSGTLPDALKSPALAQNDAPRSNRGQREQMTDLGDSGTPREGDGEDALKSSILAQSDVPMTNRGQREQMADLGDSGTPREGDGEDALKSSILTQSDTRRSNSEQGEQFADTGNSSTLLEGDDEDASKPLTLAQSDVPMTNRGQGEQFADAGNSSTLLEGDDGDASESPTVPN